MFFFFLFVIFDYETTLFKFMIVVLNMIDTFLVAFVDLSYTVDTGRSRSSGLQ